MYIGGTITCVSVFCKWHIFSPVGLQCCSVLSCSRCCMNHPKKWFVRCSSEHDVAVRIPVHVDSTDDKSGTVDFLWPIVWMASLYWSENNKTHTSLVQMGLTQILSRNIGLLSKRISISFVKHSFQGICLQSINWSYITLIPKCDGATKISEFRPISLLNTSMKTIIKLLANRLQSVIQKLIHKNQYSFIQSRTIQDCFAWALEYLHLCRKSNKHLLILKLDFEKTFDKVEHSAMLNIMQHKGFGPKWLQWMSMIFSSSTSSVLLNGVPGKVLHCRRGVRQGDPLSPLLFVLTADVLQSLLNQAKIDGLLQLPIQGQHNQDFQILPT